MSDKSDNTVYKSQVQHGLFENRKKLKVCPRLIQPTLRDLSK